MLYAIAIIAQEDGVAIGDVIERGHEDLAIRVALRIKAKETPADKYNKQKQEEMQKPETFAS